MGCERAGPYFPLVDGRYECYRCGRGYYCLVHMRVLDDDTEVCRWCITDNDPIHPGAVADGLTPEPAPPGPRPWPNRMRCERGLD
jgi:hypothetical protein